MRPLEDGSTRDGELAAVAGSVGQCATQRCEPLEARVATGGFRFHSVAQTRGGRFALVLLDPRNSRRDGLAFEAWVALVPSPRRVRLAALARVRIYPSTIREHSRMCQTVRTGSVKKNRRALSHSRLCGRRRCSPAAQFRPGRKTKTSWSRLCLLYTSPSPRDQRGSRMPSSA